MILRRTAAGLAACVALALASAPGEAAACSWAHAPEPVGDTAALYIGGRMLAAAAYVDVAVAESVEPVRLPSGPHPFVKAVRFRVTERLKGRSPDHFTLFATALQEPGARGPEATALRHWVDEQSGVVYPFPTPWEPSPDPEMSMSTCDPGFIEPVRGRPYLIFRGADGGLLGPVEFVPGKPPVRGFTFIEADAPDAAWNRTVRLLLARTGAAERAPPPLPPPLVAADPTRASVSFRRLLSEAEARDLLEGAGARPYQVFMSVRGRRVVHETPPAEAGAAVLAGARARAVAVLGDEAPSGGIVARARHALDGVTAEAFAADPDKVGYARMLLGGQENQAATAAAARSAASLIYGVEVSAGPEAQAALARSPLVHAVTPAVAVRGRSAAVDPENVADASTPDRISAELEGLGPADVYARLQALAAAPLRPRSPPPPAP